MKKRKAFLIMDVVMALCILGILMSLMAIGLSSHQRTALQLAHTRAACNAVELALTSLQRGQPPATTEPVDHLQIDRVDTNSAVPDYSWVRVTATVSGRTVSLTGLAKTIALNGGN